MHLLEKLEQNRNLTLEEWQALIRKQSEYQKEAEKRANILREQEFWQPDLCTRIDRIYKLLQK